MRTDLIKSVRILQLSSRGARWGRSAAYGGLTVRYVIGQLQSLLLDGCSVYCL